VDGRGARMRNRQKLKAIPVGSTFHRLTTVSEVFPEDRNTYSRGVVRVRCECEREFTVIASALRRGDVKQCLSCAIVHRGTKHRKYEGTDKERVRAGWLQREYGLSVEAFDAWLAAQGNRCRICKTSDPGGIGNWHVDHNHVTNRLRGILCHRCNRVLGFVKENPEILREAANYLERTGSTRCQTC
jgi:hypothetical protein